MKLILIAAHDENLVIGKDGRLPWHLPGDLKHFKQTTMGSPILMGRGVFDELGHKPLPGRRNIVLSSKIWPEAESYTTIDAALSALKAEEKVFIIGGGQIYRQFLDLCDSMIITMVKGKHDGDVYFPEYRDQIGRVWLEISREFHEEFDFVEYLRIKR